MMKNATLASLGRQFSVVLITALLTFTSVIVVSSNTSRAEITIYTNQPQYYLEEEVIVYGQLTDNGTGVENSPICVEVNDSAGNNIFGACQLTMAQGNYTFVFTLQNTTPFDVYIAAVHALVYDIRANITFDVVSTTITAKAIGPDTGAAGIPVAFSGLVTGGKLPYQWSWDFGDSNTSEEQNPTHVYALPGQYIVMLTVTDHGGFSGYDTMNITIVPDFNHPPNAPIISGPTNGEAGMSIDFHISALDVDGDTITLFVINTGDGTLLTLEGPFASGENASFSYTWAQPGAYTMIAQATDVNQATSNWSDPLMITIVVPELNVTIGGGFGLAIDIQNKGETNATNITVDVNFSGGMIILPKYRHTEITIDTLAPQVHVIVKIFVFGLGKVSITVQLQHGGAPPVQYQINAFVLGVFVLNVS